MLCSDSAQSNDLTYKDALLDTQARLFFRSELGHAEPSDPQGAFGELLSKIEATLPATSGCAEVEKAQPQRRTTPRHSPHLANPLRPRPAFAQSLRAALSNSFAARVVPGGVALALILFVLGSNAAQLRGGLVGQDGLPLGSDAGAPPELREAPAQGSSTSSQVSQVVVSSIAEAPTLHPVEMGMRPHDLALWEQLSPRDFGKYARTKFGPE